MYEQNKNFFLLNQRQAVIGRLSTDQMISCHEHLEISKAGQIEIEVPLSKNNLAQLQEAQFITIPTARWEQRFYYITSIKVDNNVIYCQGIEEGYNELAGYGFIKDIRPTNKYIDEIAEQILDGTRWTLDRVPPSWRQTKASLNFYYCTRLEALQELLAKFGGQLIFYVLVDETTGAFKTRDVKIRNNAYEDVGDGVRATYGTNVLRLIAEERRDQIYTALIGRGRGVEVANPDVENQGYSRKLTFDTVTWTKPGKPLNKPRGQVYLEDPTATAQFGYPDGSPRYGFIEFEDEDNAERLLQRTYEQLKFAAYPKMRYELDLTPQDELIELGTDVLINRYDLGISVPAQVIKLDLDLLGGQSTAEIGNFTGTGLASRLKTMDTRIKNITTNMTHSVDLALAKANAAVSEVETVKAENRKLRATLENSAETKEDQHGKSD